MGNTQYRYEHLKGCLISSESIAKIHAHIYLQITTPIFLKVDQSLWCLLFEKGNQFL